MTAYTSDHYAALIDAIAMGATKVKYQDKEVEYRSLKEMNSLKAAMEKELGLSNNRGSGRTVAVYNSGL